MRTVHCPLCGLRYAHVSELDTHVRDEHAPPAGEERREVLRVARARVREAPVDQVLARRAPAHAKRA